MTRIAISFFFLVYSSIAFSQIEKLYLQNKSPEYDDVIAFYQNLDEQYEHARLLSFGNTDAGLPLHLFVIDSKKEFHPNSNRIMLMVMNAIHGGEPCGVDASMNLAHDLLKSGNIPENVVLGIIPIYNVGGALNRNSTTRTNQNGPEVHGFRANAKNYDLNRDFIKMDTKNAWSFAQVYHEWKPQLFADTHTSNGADYQYTFTLISTLKDKLNPVLVPFLEEEIEPYLYKGMKQKGFEMTPYVWPMDKTPDNGIKAFIDLPRYSIGYTALFNTIGFTTEAHMFKSYPDRVNATNSFLNLLLKFANDNAKEVLQYKRLADRMAVNKTNFDVRWVLDSLHTEILFKGYKASYKESLVSGQQRLYYDRAKPYTDSIAYYGSYVSTQKVKRPKYYIIPQAWDEVITRLKENKVAIQELKKDSAILVTSYYIEKYETRERPYEGHYLHYDIELREVKEKRKYRKGDFLVPMGQLSDYYTVTVLDPRSSDSFFAWNFFDTYLQQKEWFSAYVFEEEALEMLENDTVLKARLEEKVASDSTFAKSGDQQLYFIYKNSEHYEKEHLRYPISRVD